MVYFYTLIKNQTGGIVAERRMIAFSDLELHKMVNLIAETKDVAAQEVVRKGIEMYLKSLKKEQAEFFKRMAKR
jgi:hypothetical protein